MSPQLKALGAAAAVGILVGAAMVSTKAVSGVVSPATLAFLRYLIGAAFLLLPWSRAPRTVYSRKDAAAIAVLGICQFALLVLLLNYALQTIPASLCALVFSTMPLLTAALAVLTGNEPYRQRRLVGVSLAVLGVVYLLLASSASNVSAAPRWPGLLAVIAATLIGAVTSILYGPYLRRYPALPTCRLAMLAAVAFLAVFCLLTSQTLWPELSPMQWSNVVFIGLSSGVGFLCWLWSLGKLEPSKVTAFQALGPVTAALLESLILQRLPSLSLLVALLMVSAGLLVATRRR